MDGVSGITGCFAYRIEIQRQAERDRKFAEIAAAKPDILFLDLYLVSLDSKELCSLLKSKDETKNIPLYLVSFSDIADTEHVAIDVNADGAFSKPIARDNIEELIRKHYPA